MSGEPRGRVDRVLENYLLALAGVDQCDASALEEVKTRLAANAARAERAWADAEADGLVDLDTAMEASAFPKEIMAQAATMRNQMQAQATIAAGQSASTGAGQSVK